MSSSLTTQTIKEEEKMNEIQVFSNEKFGQVRTVMQDGEPWFVAADVCKAFGVDNSRNIVARLDDDEKGVHNVDTLGGKQTVTIINEAGLYHALFTMEPKRATARGIESGEIVDRLKALRTFKRWITHEVIPTIRKTGGYVNNSEVFIQNYLPFADDTTKQLFRLTLDVVDKQNKQIADQQKELAEKSAAIEEMTPKASYYDIVINSPDLIPITIIAKDYGKSGTWLNRKLNEKGVQYRREKTWVLYHQYADKGYVGTKTYAYSGKAYGAEKHVAINTFWTQRGRLFIYELLKGEGILPIVERGVA